jgi:hypothetical protein
VDSFGLKGPGFSPNFQKTFPFVCKNGNVNERKNENEKINDTLNQTFWQKEIRQVIIWEDVLQL